ncbi:MAG: hypothetical protein QM762_01045 [Chryseolinea sp.]
MATTSKSLLAHVRYVRKLSNDQPSEVKDVYGRSYSFDLKVNPRFQGCHHDVQPLYNIYGEQVTTYGE